MATIQENTQPFIYKIDKNFAYNFDILQNIKAWSRKSDIWFSDENKLMISMRDWTTQLWNNITWWAWWGSRLFFFTDFLNKRHCVRWYNNRIYWLNTSNQWIDITWDMSWNNFYFNTVKLPLMIDWSNPTEYTMPVDATGSELIKKDTADTWWISNIWKVLFVTENTWNSNVYRWCFWFINWFDTDTNEYIIWDSWILWTLNAAWDLIWIKSWSKYKIFDSIWEFLQICNWSSLEKYFFWKTDWTLEEFVNYRWLATYWLRNVKAFKDNQFVYKQIYWNNSYFTWNRWTLFYSSWNVNNPFFYTFTNAISIPSLNWWSINDIFIFKERLIIAWNNFISYINNFTTLVEIKSISWTFWMKSNSLADLWTDSYFISSNRQIYSLQETLAWTLIATNIWKNINNYIKEFYTNICSWFDWRRLYFYWQSDSNTPWVIVVLDVEYKFWSIYTWLRPASIVNEDWVIYMTDNNSHIVRYFDPTTTKDVWNVNIEQKIMFNEFSWASVFIWKTIASFLAWFDNFSQELYVDIYMANPKWNWRKQRKLISIQEVDVNQINSPMWDWNMWEWILWWAWYEKDISFPFMKRISLDSDIANIWKISLTWKDWSPFYLNEAMIDYKPNETLSYFSPENTI